MTPHPSLIYPNGYAIAYYRGFWIGRTYDREFFGEEFPWLVARFEPREVRFTRTFWRALLFVEWSLDPDWSWPLLDLLERPELMCPTVDDMERLQPDLGKVKYLG